MDSKIVIGVDDSGKGALAGPLTVCAVAFKKGDPPVTATYHGVRGEKLLTAGDSKGFTNPLHREVLSKAIKDAALGFVVVERTAEEIDARLMFHVYPETVKLAVSRLLEQLIAKGGSKNPHDYLVMLDGETQIPIEFGCPVRAIADGDKLVWQIGAASILAKVVCDDRMDALHAEFPSWGFDKHRGYPTAAHKAMLCEHGPTKVHRRTFRPVAEAQGPLPGFEI